MEPAVGSTAARARVQIANPSDGGFFFWLGKLYGFSLFLIIAVAVGILLTVYRSYLVTTPPLPDLRATARSSAAVTRVHASDGTLLGEFSEEWRELVPYDEIPPALTKAFIAIEDHEFFVHGGIYFKGLLRAAWRNATAGEWAQGGSTITQQVAKQFLGREKTLDRKIREAILARRLEARYSKEEILSFYMNHIFLGSGSYGVGAAARRYFSKPLAELTVGEMAVIAGLAQAPSRDSPLDNPEAARRRRDMVLDAMARYGDLTAQEAESWKATPLTLRPYREVFRTTEPYFAEHVRRDLKERYGQDGLMRRGLQVETTIEPVVDAIAYENVDWGARKQDKRQGWRGPEAHLEGAARQLFVERQTARYGTGPIPEEKRILALVEEVKSEGATVRVGPNTYKLPLRRMSWAAKWSRTDDTNDHTINSATEALRAGDVVWVSRAPSVVRKFSEWDYDDHLNAYWREPGKSDVPPDEVRLEQTPHVQTALITMDHATGYVLAMAGGTDHARSEYNRAVQACRQPGSTYKPIYYSAALDEGYGFETQLDDVPHETIDPETGAVWVPVNLHGTVDTQVTLEYALVFSKNIPSVEVFEMVGAKDVEKWARRLGFTSTIIADQALALGASCVYMHELNRAFAIFARNGKWVDVISVRRVTDREGKVLEDNTVTFDPYLGPGSRLDRVAATAGIAPREAISARAAYLTTKLLRSVVTNGYSGSLRNIEIPAAGKTGTSSATMDMWFTAFTSRWTTTFWLGDDLRERPLGKKDAAFMSAVPMWARYTAEAAGGFPHTELPVAVPAGVKQYDRGGTKGRQAGGPMDLVPPHKTKKDELVTPPPPSDEKLPPS
jgi:penicillin-binding protein 1A